MSLLKIFDKKQHIWIDFKPFDGFGGGVGWNLDFILFVIYGVW